MHPFPWKFIHVTQPHLKNNYSWPSASMGSSFSGSSNLESKIFGKNYRKFQKSKLEFATSWQLFT